MDGIHWTDLLVVVVLGLLIFGPKRLPEIGSSVGAALRNLRNALHEGSLPRPDITPVVPDGNAASARAEPAERGGAKTAETQHVETGPPV